MSADLQIVPAQMPVDVGLDRQLVGAYGHDDRSNGFAAFRAIVEVRAPQKTAIAYGVNNEEVELVDHRRRIASGSARWWPRSSPRRSRHTAT